MSAPLLYRPARKWPLVAAFFTAILIHLGAVTLAGRNPQVAASAVVQPRMIVDVIDEPSDPIPPVDPPEITPPPPPPVPMDEELFPNERPTPPPVKPPTTISRLARSNTGATPGARLGSPKLVAISAPRPEYPYEARRQRLTGTGVATLTIDPATGNVINVTMSQSTGSAVLDNATVSGLRRWRFRPGTAARVQTPITYTLTGASY